LTKQGITASLLGKYTQKQVSLFSTYYKTLNSMRQVDCEIYAFQFPFIFSDTVPFLFE